MPAAIAVPAIIGAASSIGGAAMQAKAAKNAAKTQQQAADRAMQVQQQTYGDQLGLMRPYVQAGQDAMSTLGALTRPGPGATYAGGAPDARPAYPQVPGQYGQSLPLGQIPPAQSGRMPAAQSGRIPPAALGQMSSAPMGPRGGPSLGSMGQPQTIMMQAPDGSTAEVPAHLEQQFSARGARRVQ